MELTPEERQRIYLEEKRVLRYAGSWRRKVPRYPSR